MSMFLIVKRENGNIKPLYLRDSYEAALYIINYLQLAFPKAKFDIYQLEPISENHD